MILKNFLSSIVMKGSIKCAGTPAHLVECVLHTQESDIPECL